MDENIKLSINARKNSILDSYKVTPEQKKELDDLFKEIEELGGTCKDAGDFETKLAASPLNQRYIDLFTKVATSSASDTAAKNMAAGMATSAAESAVKNAIGTAVPTTKAAVHQKAYDAARDIPVVGNAIDIGQKASYIKHLGGLFGKKKK